MLDGCLLRCSGPWVGRAISRGRFLLTFVVRACGGTGILICLACAGNFSTVGAGVFGGMTLAAFTVFGVLWHF